MFDEDSCFESYCPVCDKLIPDAKLDDGTTPTASPCLVKKGGLKPIKPIPPVFKSSKTGAVKSKASTVNNGAGYQPSAGPSAFRSRQLIAPTRSDVALSEMIKTSGESIIRRNMPTTKLPSASTTNTAAGQPDNPPPSHLIAPRTLQPSHHSNVRGFPTTNRLTSTSPKSHQALLPVAPSATCNSTTSDKKVQRTMMPVHSFLYCSIECQQKDLEQSFYDLEHFQTMLAHGAAPYSPPESSPNSFSFGNRENIKSPPLSPLFVSGSESEDGSYFPVVSPGSTDDGRFLRLSKRDKERRGSRGTTSTMTESSTDSLSSMWDHSHQHQLDYHSYRKKMTPLSIKLFAPPTMATTTSHRKLSPLSPRLSKSDAPTHLVFDLERAIQIKPKQLRLEDRRRRPSSGQISDPANVQEYLGSHLSPSSAIAAPKNNRNQYHHHHHPQSLTFEPGTAPATASLYANYAASFTRISSSQPITRMNARRAVRGSSQGSVRGQTSASRRLSSQINHSSVTDTSVSPSLGTTVLSDDDEEGGLSDENDELLRAMEEAREMRRRGRAPPPQATFLLSQSCLSSSQPVTPTQNVNISNEIVQRRSLSQHPYQQNFHFAVRSNCAFAPQSLPQETMRKQWSWDKSERVYDVPRLAPRGGSGHGIAGSFGEGKKLFYFEKD